MFTKHAKIGEEFSYGYGWIIGHLYNRKLAMHHGSISGFRASLFRFPEEKLFIVSLSNYEQAKPPKINENLAAILFNEKYEPPINK